MLVREDQALYEVRPAKRKLALDQQVTLADGLAAAADPNPSRIVAHFGNNPLELTGLRPPSQWRC